MPRRRPASNPVSFHRPTGQFYTTRGGRRIYLGVDRQSATEQYHRLALGLQRTERRVADASISAKELANRFITAQQANWRNPQQTLRCYQGWLRRFLKDHPRLRAMAFNVEIFAAWKLLLRQRGYAPETINHYLNSVRAMFAFGYDADLLERAPRLRRVKNESRVGAGLKRKPLYSQEHLRKLLACADRQVRLMLLLGVNCGFGPKDIQDLKWDDFKDDRVTLPRSKTGISQSFRLWPESLQALQGLRKSRRELKARMAKRGRIRTDNGHIFVTKFWRPWCKDAVARQFRKLCARAGVTCHGFYRLRHGASTAISLVANPHVQRRFMRHSQLQQQVTYTHTPDAEVDTAIMKARDRLLGEAITSDQGNDRERAVDACDVPVALRFLTANDVKRTLAAPHA